MQLIAEWDAFVYDDGTPVAGEVIHLEMSTDGTTWTEIAAGAPDAAEVQFDAPIQYGQTIQFRARGQVGAEFGPYTETVSYTAPFPPVPAVQNLRIGPV
jgi:hypothetical protein